MRILKLTEDTRKDILQNLLKRSPNNYGEFEGRVNAIIEEVRNNRDQAVFNYTKQFDGADITSGKSCGSRPYCNVYATRQRWKSISFHSGCSQRSRSG